MRGSNEIIHKEKHLMLHKCSTNNFMHNHREVSYELKSGNITCGPRSKGEDKEEI